MNKGFTIESFGDYIYVLHEPNFQMTRDTLEVLWSELTEACEQADCSAILIEAPSPKRKMDTTAAFEAGAKLSQVTPGVKVAMFLEGYEPDELTEFFKTVARNRGARIEFFSDKESALEWLEVGRSTSMP